MWHLLVYQELSRVYMSPGDFVKIWILAHWVYSEA